MTDSVAKTPYEVGNDVFHEVMRSAPRDGELPEENRGSWYCPCATERHERLIRHLADEINAQRIYDLGAGDLRLSAALADDFHVVAYENNEFLANRAYNLHGKPDIDLRTTSYYHHWDAMKDRNAVFAAIGETNNVPGKPSNGVSIQGNENLVIQFAEGGSHD